ncbi:MAG TPA: hypothetical protein DDW20_03075 [Firmicutes bacterium]|nr:hypothetical protein [Bacillota bacterium]
MQDKIKIIPLGGQDETAKNMIVIEINDDIFVIDAGAKYPDKTMHGIDYLIPRFDYLYENKDKVRAYIILRGHDTTFGALPFIYSSVPAPIYCTDITRIFIEYFLLKNKLKVNFDYKIKDTSADFEIAGRRIRFFPTCTNMAHSIGVAISTSEGNVVVMDDFVIDNNSDKGYLTSSKMLSSVTEEDTLLLMLDSSFSDRPGFSNPTYKIVPQLERAFKDAQGRIFIVLNDLDLYNTEMIFKLGYKLGRKIFPFDDGAKQKYLKITEVYNPGLPKNAFMSLDDINRIPPQNVLVVLPSYGQNIYHKISLLAQGQSEDKRLKIVPSDTFILGIQKSNTNETILTNTIDELYHTNCKIIYFDKKQFIRMHPSQEDLKTMLALFSPKHFLPINASYTNLLNSARLAVDMGIGLNHMNVFVMDNGMILDLKKTGSRLLPSKVESGDLLVDGKRVGQEDSSLISERNIMGEDGVVILAAGVSKSAKKIVLGPDIQTRGLIFVKESEALLKEINKVFTVTLEEGLKNNFSLNVIKDNICDIVFKTIRRHTLKSPLIIPHIEVLD